MAKKTALSKATSTKPVPVKVVSEPKSNYVEEDKKWRTEADLRTLQEAEKIKADRERIKAVKACAKEQVKFLSKIK